MVSILSPRRGTANPIDATLDGILERARPALDALQTNVFVASLELELVYVNPLARTTLGVIEPQVRAATSDHQNSIAGAIHEQSSVTAEIGRLAGEAEGFNRRLREALEAD